MRKGLFRIWIVASALWLLLIGVAANDDLVVGQHWSASNEQTWLALALLPPLAVLWIAKGFASHK